jgi:hypothetical protein
MTDQSRIDRQNCAIVSEKPAVPGIRHLTLGRCHEAPTPARSDDEPVSDELAVSLLNGSETVRKRLRKLRLGRKPHSGYPVPAGDCADDGIAKDHVFWRVGRRLDQASLNRFDHFHFVVVDAWSVGFNAGHSDNLRIFLRFLADENPEFLRRIADQHRRLRFQNLAHLGIFQGFH